jgi:hypothetical protein
MAGLVTECLIFGSPTACPVVFMCAVGDDFVCLAGLSHPWGWLCRMRRANCGGSSVGVI